MSSTFALTSDAMTVRYPKSATEGDRMVGILSGGNFHVRCGKRHRTIGVVARCCWPKTVWVQGDGPYATVSRCVAARPRYAVMSRCGCTRPRPTPATPWR